MAQDSQPKPATVEFNLLREDWIPVLLNDGTFLRVNPVRCLEEARTIRSIAAPSPMDRLSILRFLLALLCWCRVYERMDKVHSEEWIDLRDCIPRLKDEIAYFNLFGGPPRFYQFRLPEKEKQEEFLSTAYLIHELPAGSNVPFFIKARECIDGLCPRCCALGLLRLPLFTTMGGRGKKPGINGKPPVYFVPLGKTLGETLMLSLRKISSLNLALGEPSWKSPEPTVEGNSVPLLKGLTWLPRAVWLQEPLSHEYSQNEVCIYCGRSGPVVRSMIYAGRKWAKNLKWRDPHVLYQNDRPLVLRDESKLKQLRYKRRSGALAILLAMLEDSELRETLRAISAGRETNLWAIALVSQQNKYIEAVEHIFPVSSILEDPDSLAKKIDEQLSPLTKIEKNLTKIRRKPQDQKGKRKAPLVAQAILNHFYPHFERSHMEGLLRKTAAQPLIGESLSELQTAISRTSLLSMLPNKISALRKANWLESRILPDRPRKDPRRR